MSIYLYPPQYARKVHMGKFFKRPKDPKEEEKKKVWLSKNIYVYLLSNRGYDDHRKKKTECVE